jgi:uncharacterized protein (DUF433 family)
MKGEFIKQVEIPLTVESDGIVRVRHKTVKLESIAYAYEDGLTAEEIVYRFPTLTLAEVYIVLSFYLEHRREVEIYLAARSMSSIGFCPAPAA